nr:MAG TPA: hypothetical protein [Caudoviricetes sp.]
MPASRLYRRSGEAFGGRHESENSLPAPPLQRPTHSASLQL